MSCTGIDTTLRTVVRRTLTVLLMYRYYTHNTLGYCLHNNRIFELKNCGMLRFSSKVLFNIMS